VYELLAAIADQRFTDPVPQCGYWIREALHYSYIERVQDGACARFILTALGRACLDLYVDIRNGGGS
jgi:hypothetical protein